MRAVVIAVKNGQAAITDETGGMHYIDDKGYVTGQIIDWQHSDSAVPFMKKDRAGIYSLRAVRTIAGVAAGLILFAGAGGITATAATATTVTIGNYGSDTTLEYRVNAFDRVIGFEAHDAMDADAAKEIGKNIRWMKLDKAIELSLESMDTETVKTIGSGDIEGIEIKVDSRIKGRDLRLEDVTRRELEASPVFNSGEIISVSPSQTDPEPSGTSAPEDAGQSSPENAGQVSPGAEDSDTGVNSGDNGAVQGQPPAINPEPSGSPAPGNAGQSSPENAGQASPGAEGSNTGVNAGDSGAGQGQPSTINPEPSGISAPEDAGQSSPGNAGQASPGAEDSNTGVNAGDNGAVQGQPPQIPPEPYDSSGHGDFNGEPPGMMGDNPGDYGGNDGPGEPPGNGNPPEQQPQMNPAPPHP